MKITGICRDEMQLFALDIVRGSRHRRIHRRGEASLSDFRLALHSDEARNARRVAQFPPFSVFFVDVNRQTERVRFDPRLGINDFDNILGSSKPPEVAAVYRHRR